MEEAARPGPRPVTPRSEDQPSQALVPASTALAIERAGTMQTAFQGLMPTSIGEVALLSQHLAKSSAIPGGMKGQPDTVFTIVWAGMELGLTPIRALQSISNISGTLCMKADLQLALAKSKAVLGFWEEGFEERGKTDGNLADRIQLTFKLAKIPDFEDQAVLTIQKITAVTSDLKPGNPYGWAVGCRTGDPRIQVRTFTFADAERAIIYEKDEGNPNGPREKKPLSQKFNYKSFPGDMYPKRARTRLLQILASDVTNGLPAVETLEGGQVIDAEYSRVEDEASGDTADSLLAAVEVEHPELGMAIRNGFKQLTMNQAKQLQKLTQFKGKPNDLLEWMKTEYANRKGVPRHQADVLGQPGDTPQQPATTQAPPVQDAQVIEEPQQQTQQQTEQPAAAGPESVKEEPKKKASKTGDLAARFKAGATF